MATVIADTSPLQYLFQVGLIDLLPRLFETVDVPEAVRDELAAGRERGIDVPNPDDFPWMSVTPVALDPAVQRFGLGNGESAALALALATRDSLVLLDDAAARTAASQLGVPITGTLGLVLLGKESHLVEAVAPVIVSLERRGFRITEAVRLRILQLASE
jgi:predicted nucleic acid-binding protein